MSEDSIWGRKGGTLSDKTAQQEFGLSQQEIYQAVREGKLQYRENNVFGNPYLRLLRHELERLVAEKCGERGLERKKLEHELAQVKQQLRKLKTQTASLERRRVELTRILSEKTKGEN